MSNTVTKSSRVKLIAALAVFAMAFTALSLVPADASDADNSTTVSTWKELKNAVKNSSYDDVITLACDIIDESDSDPVVFDHFESRITIDLNGFTIDRKRGGSDDEDGRLFEVSNISTLIIRNGTLTGGHEDNGGCIYVDEAFLRLYDVIITGNYAEDDGGAIYSDEGQVEFYGGQLVNNRCGDDGAAIYTNGEEDSWAGITSIDDVIISGNYADDDGGAFYIEDYSHLTISKATISDNRAKDGKGGALFATTSYYEFVDCTFTENYAYEDGGAIYSEGTSVGEDWERNYLQSTVFTKNHARENGGAISMDESGLKVSGCTFDGNYCDDGNGGAINADDTKMEIKLQDETQTVFKNNKASKSGGALMLYDGDYLIRNVIFEGNKADDHGGAIYVNDEAKVHFLSSKFYNNYAKLDGGAILAGGDDNEIIFEDTIIAKDNTSGRDGPNVFIRSDRKITCNHLLNDCQIGIDLEDQKRKFTKDFGDNNPGADPATFFISDDSKYYIALDPDSGEAKTFKEGSGGDMSEDNTVWIVVGIIAAVVVIGALVYFFVVRKP